MNVSGAFHSPLMNNARIYLEKFIKSIVFKNTKTPIYQNYCPNKNFNSIEIRKNLISQLDNPVRWLETINNMNIDGFNNFIEVGPKNILSNLNKSINRNFNTITFEHVYKENIINA